MKYENIKKGTHFVDNKGNILEFIRFQSDILLDYIELKDKNGNVYAYYTEDTEEIEEIGLELLYEKKQTNNTLIVPEP